MNSNTNSYTNPPIVPLNSYTNPPTVSLEEVIAHQSYAGGWICSDCKHYKGNLKGDKNMFISFVGCYTKDCQTFEDKNKDEK